MPHVRHEAGVSEGDQTWLGSTRGITTNRTEVLDLSAFTVDPAVGYIPSGYPLALINPADPNTRSVVPYVSGAVDDTGILAGFLFTDQVVMAGDTEDLNVPVQDFGRIRTERLPVAFTVPAAGKSAGNFVFI